MLQFSREVSKSQPLCLKKKKKKTMKRKLKLFCLRKVKREY